MRLNKATSHALRVLVACAESSGELRKVADMAAALDLSEQNVFKIVHLLSRAGLVTAERGRRGGVRLSRPADQIRVGDVVTAMEALPQAIGEDGSLTDASQTGHGALFDDAFEAFLAVLNRSTVADMSRVRQAASPRRTKAKLVTASRAAGSRKRARNKATPPRVRPAKAGAAARSSPSD